MKDFLRIMSKMFVDARPVAPSAMDMNTVRFVVRGEPFFSHGRDPMSVYSVTFIDYSEADVVFDNPNAPDEITSCTAEDDYSTHAGFLIFNRQNIIISRTELEKKIRKALTNRDKE